MNMLEALPFLLSTQFHASISHFPPTKTKWLRLSDEPFDKGSGIGSDTNPINLSWSATITGRTETDFMMRPLPLKPSVLSQNTTLVMDNEGRREAASGGSGGGA